MDLFEAHACHPLATRDFSVFSVLEARTVVFFTVHDEYLGAYYRSPDRLRTWGPYPPACLLLPPCAILHF